MLSSLSFRLALVFSLNSLILTAFPLASFHLAEAKLATRTILKNEKPLFRLTFIAKRCTGINAELKTHNLLFRGFIFLCAQLPRNVTKCFLFIIIHIFSTHFGINLFYLHNLKTQPNYGTTTAPCI